MKAYLKNIPMELWRLQVLDGRTAPRTAAMDTFRWGSWGDVVRRMGTQQQQRLQVRCYLYFKTGMPSYFTAIFTKRDNFMTSL